MKTATPSSGTRVAKPLRAISVHSNHQVMPGARARPLHSVRAMMNSQRAVAMTVLLGLAASAAAQTPPKEPPPLWDVQLGAAFVGTSGNSETSTIGADFGFHRRWPLWQVESAATA